MSSSQRGNVSPITVFTGIRSYTTNFYIYPTALLYCCIAYCSATRRFSQHRDSTGTIHGSAPIGSIRLLVEPSTFLRLNVKGKASQFRSRWLHRSLEKSIHANEKHALRWGRPRPVFKPIIHYVYQMEDLKNGNFWRDSQKSVLTFLEGLIQWRNNDFISQCHIRDLDVPSTSNANYLSKGRSVHSSTLK